MKWKELRKIAVSGSRRFEEPDLATAWLDIYIRKNYKEIDNVVLITGEAHGIDMAVYRYCLRRGIKHLICNARWLEFDKAAGFRRNKHIIDLANELVAFWDFKSRGTKHAIKCAKEKGISYQIIGPKKLRKLMKLKPIVTVKLPTKTTNRDAHKIRELIEDAELGDLLRKKKRGKKENFFEDMGGFNNGR